MLHKNNRQANDPLSLPSPLPTALVSRQYVDMSRIRIEGLLAAFPKLVGTGKQHTYVETENVRYVYQPMEVCVCAAHCSPAAVWCCWCA